MTADRIDYEKLADDLASKELRPQAGCWPTRETALSVVLALAQLGYDVVKVEHRVHLETRWTPGRAVRAICSCGWESDETPTGTPALIARTNHLRLQGEAS